MAKERESLTSLTDRISRKVSPIREVVPEPEPKAQPTRKDNRVQVLVRMTPTERKALRQIALNQDTTVQSLVEEAIRDLLRRHGS